MMVARSVTCVIVKMHITSIEWVQIMDFFFIIKTMIVLVWVIRCKHWILKEALRGAVVF